MKNKFINLSMITATMIFLSACGGGSTTTSYGDKNVVKDEDKPTKPKSDITISGRVIDGYIKNATIFLDLNRDFKQEDGEPFTKTDKYGRFSLGLSQELYDTKITGMYPLISKKDGIDTATEKPFKYVLVNNPTRESSKKPIILSPVSTFYSTTAFNSVKGNISKDITVINFGIIVNKVLGLDGTENINYIKDSNSKYYKINNILQKAVEIAGIDYLELTSKLQKDDKNLNDLFARLNKPNEISSMKKFYESLTDKEIEEKKINIQKTIDTKISKNEFDFENINKSNILKDTKEQKDDLDDNKVDIPIKDGIIKNGIFYSIYNKEATIFLDKNRNYILDKDEPRTTTDENGNFKIEIEKESINKRRSLIAINGKNSNKETSNEIYYTTPMLEGNVVINTFTSFQTAAALAVNQSLTKKGIFHSNFTEVLLKSLGISINDLTKNDTKEPFNKKAMLLNNISKAIANTFEDGITNNTMVQADIYLISNINVDDNEAGIRKLIDRYNINNPKKNDKNEKFSDIINEIYTIIENSTQDQLYSDEVQNKLNKLVTKSSEFRLKKAKDLKAIDYNLNSDTPLPKDQFSKYQWHLKDQGGVINTYNIRSVGGNDLEVEDLYSKGIVGKNVYVRIVDDGVEATHEDLKDRIDLTNSYNAETKKNDPTSPKLEDSHGTQVAGLIAADGSNSIGVRGVAPYATISAYKLKTPSKGALDYTYEELTKAWLGGNDEISIVNNSWGATIDKHIEEEAILKKGATTKRIVNRGRGDEALGRIYLIASGNGGFNQGKVENVVDDSVTSYIRGSQYAITVAAVRNENIVTQYSAQGSNVLVSGYGGGVKVSTSALMTTTTRTGQSKTTWNEDVKKAYSFAFDGTSAATPVTSGALALVIGECPNLSYRDVKWLIAHTSKKIDENYNGLTIKNVPNVPPYKTTPTKNLYQGFGYIKNAAGLSHSNYYGYGLINPKAMIEKCKASDFKYLPSKKSIKVINKNTSLTNLKDNNQSLEEKIRINKNEIDEKNKLDKIEWVGLTLYSDIKNLQKVSMVLISPSGTKSRILTNSKTALADMAKLEYGYRFSSVAFVDEDPYGEWTLLVQTDDKDEKGRFFKIELEVVGYKQSERK